MPSATVTSKGQVTLPKRIRVLLQLEEGDRVAFRERPDGTVVLEPETLDFMSMEGRIRPRVRGVSLDEMDAAVRRAVTKRHAGENR
ncbi:MAG: AbrB/MazE/SpoVT family DNA-binding domain-containing protein [Polyangiaceae bacterium]|nr:AbrB/MazE/SpoVT family DNA-binding domain-containing protein [Polyangiaceae bacterium]